jgi:hypothetical protein
LPRKGRGLGKAGRLVNEVRLARKAGQGKQGA